MCARCTSVLRPPHDQVHAMLSFDYCLQLCEAPHESMQCVLIQAHMGSISDGELAKSGSNVSTALHLLIMLI